MSKSVRAASALSRECTGSAQVLHGMLHRSIGIAANEVHRQCISSAFEILVPVYERDSGIWS